MVFLWFSYEVRSVSHNQRVGSYYGGSYDLLSLITHLLLVKSPLKCSSFRHHNGCLAGKFPMWEKHTWMGGSFGIFPFGNPRK